METRTRKCTLWKPVQIMRLHLPDTPPAVCFMAPSAPSPLRRGAVTTIPLLNRVEKHYHCRLCVGLVYNGHPFFVRYRDRGQPTVPQRQGVPNPGFVRQSMCCAMLAFQGCVSSGKSRHLGGASVNSQGFVVGPRPTGCYWLLREASRSRWGTLV